MTDLATPTPDEQPVTALYERWVKAGPPPLGVQLARWWDRRLIELRDAIVHRDTPAATEATERSDIGSEFVRQIDNPDQAGLDLWETELAQSGVDTPGCDCGHHGMGPRWHAMECAWRATDRAARTTPDHPPTGSDTPDNLHRLRTWLAAEYDKADAADRADDVPPELMIRPYNGIAAGIAIALHGVDCMLGETRPAHDAGPTVAECRQDDLRWPLQREGE